MIHMLDHVCKHFGIESASGEEIDELKLDTDPEEIVETLRSTIGPARSGYRNFGLV